MSWPCGWQTRLGGLLANVLGPGAPVHDQGGCSEVTWRSHSAKLLASAADKHARPRCGPHAFVGSLKPRPRRPLSVAAGAIACASLLATASCGEKAVWRSPSLTAMEAARQLQLRFLCEGLTRSLRRHPTACRLRCQSIAGLPSHYVLWPARRHGCGALAAGARDGGCIALTAWLILLEKEVSRLAELSAWPALSVR